MIEFEIVLTQWTGSERYFSAPYRASVKDFAAAYRAAKVYLDGARMGNRNNEYDIHSITCVAATGIQANVGWDVVAD